MVGSVNKVILVGRLGGDPQVKSFSNGGKVVNFSVATSESWKDRQSGERKERTEWHKVSITNESAASFAEQYLRKGSKVYIEGQLETRKWQDQSGADRSSTEIVVRPYNGSVLSLDSRSDGDGADRRDDSDRGRAAQGGGGSAGRGAATGGARGVSDLDDEIPFAPEVRG